MSLDDWVRGVIFVVGESSDIPLGHNDVTRLAKVYERQIEYGRKPEEAEEHTRKIIGALRMLYEVQR